MLLEKNLTNPYELSLDVDYYGYGRPHKKIN